MYKQKLSEVLYKLSECRGVLRLKKFENSGLENSVDSFSMILRGGYMC